MVGDPSGRVTERPLLEEEKVQSNVEKHRVLVEKLYSKLQEKAGGGPSLEVINNASFYREQNVIDYLREVGRHFRVATLLSRDSVKSRESLSFLELGYQLL